MNQADYLADAQRQFDMCRGLAEKTMARLSDSQFFEIIGEDSNSIAHIVKHMAGNMHSRWTDFLETDGEKADRHRDTEFEIGSDDNRQSLMDRWDKGWSLVASAVDRSAEIDLSRCITIRSEPYTILQAINRQLTHYASHVGQIILIARILLGLKWESLSVPRGQSEQFNISMRVRYGSKD